MKKHWDSVVGSVTLSVYLKTYRNLVGLVLNHDQIAQALAHAKDLSLIPDVVRSLAQCNALGKAMFFEHVAVMNVADVSAEIDAEIDKLDYSQKPNKEELGKVEAL